MSRFPKFAIAAGAAVMILAGVVTSAQAGKFNIGREATADEVKAWDIDVRADGLGLPEGQGSVIDGEEIFSEKCASCHGEFGEGVDRWPVLAGGLGTITSEDPVKTIGSYWPYLSTAWDYINRAMPFGEAESLEADEVYAIVAYLMYVNELVEDEEFVLSKANFLDVRLPNEKNFFIDDRTETPVFTNRTLCMKDCIPGKAEVVGRARVLDVTPDGENNPDGSN